MYGDYKMETYSKIYIIHKSQFVSSLFKTWSTILEKFPDNVFNFFAINSKVFY